MGEGYLFYFLKAMGTQYIRLLTLTSETNIGIFQNLISLLSFPLFCLLLTLKAVKALVNFLGLNIIIENVLQFFYELFSFYL